MKSKNIWRETMHYTSSQWFPNLFLWSWGFLLEDWARRPNLFVIFYRLVQLFFLKRVVVTIIGVLSFFLYTSNILYMSLSLPYPCSSKGRAMSAYWHCLQEGLQSASLKCLIIWLKGMEKSNLLQGPMGLLEGPSSWSKYHSYQKEKEKNGMIKSNPSNIWTLTNLWHNRPSTFLLYS